MMKTHITLQKRLRNTLTVFLDFIFPRPPLVKKLESMTPAELYEQALRSRGQDKNTISLFEYRNPLIETAIWEIKYRRNEKIALLMATLLHEAILDELSTASVFQNFDEPLLVPTPASKHRLSEHGYNQCEFLVRLIERIDGRINFETANPLVKIKETPTQTSLSGRSKREKNIRGSFDIPEPKSVRGRNIILLDDVTTTGSTLREASRALREAGAKQVLVITIAH